MKEMASLVGKLRFQSSMKPTRGRAIPVYDGRSWPVVKCSPVYVAEDEKAKHVTKSVIAQSTAPEDKKKKSSKYSVAVGSTFGHVHTFLKDSDHILKEFDKTEAEDKCLLLIRKPKSASKQMFKAHSLATLNVVDPHLTLPDGTTKHEPHRFFKHKGKRKPELSIPVYGGTLTKPRSLSQGSPVSDLNANENDRRSTGDFSSSKTSDSKFSYLYPYDEMFTRKSSDLMKSKSNSDLREESKEINNNRMGAGFTRLRPRAAPPAVPTKTNVSASKTRTEVSSAVVNENQMLDDTTNNNRPDLLSNVDSKLKSAQSFNDNMHTATDSSWKNNKNQQRYSGNMSENWDSQARRKHDSGFHSDATNPGDKLYYSGFKSELNSNDIYLSSKNMAGSSTPLNQGASFGTVHLEKESLSDDGGFKKLNSDQNVPLHKSCIKVQVNQRKDGIQISKVENDGLNRETKCVRNPITNHRPRSSTMQDFVNHKTERTVSPKSQHLVATNVSSGHPHHGVASHSNVYHSQHYEASYAVSPREHSVKTQHGNFNKDSHGAKINNEHCGHKGKHVERSSSGGTKCNKRHSLSPKQRIPNGYSQIHGQHSPRGYSQNPVQQSPKETQLNKISYVESDKSIQAHQANANVKDNFEKEDPGLRAQSLGDLTAGCTFSLVGQKKAGSVQALTETEFTGSQLAKHFRKYREMKPEINHGSLPGRMKCLGHETKVRPKLEDMNIQQDNQLQVYSAGMGGRCKKQQHYGSLQHLPVTETREHRDLPNVRNREKTPIKPRRTLPQVPGDADEKKKQYTDMVKLRLASRNSSSPSSRNSNRPVSCENRQGGISATPSFSDREVSELLEGTAKDYTWVPTSISSECNKITHPKSDIIPPDAVYDKLSLSYPLYNTGPFVSHEHTTAQTGTRHCESGQNTITSQSTVDSGYITNDPETENNTALSTSSYAKSLKESSNKLFKPSKGENSVVVKGDYSKTSKHHRDHETRNWVEKHPGALVKDMKPKSVTKDELNSDFRNHSVKENVNNNPDLDDVSYVNPKNQLTHRTSEISLKEAEKYNHEKKYFKPKVKAVSMSYGLNLIESSNSMHNKSGLSKSQPKFTGSLINLTHTESQGLTCAPSLDSLKSEIKTATLPGGWRYSGGNRTESSLKMLGKPSLFQLLQNYSVYPVRLKIPENFSLLDNVRLIECEVVLPSPWTDRKDVGTVTSPKGSYAKLGGPNSAFKPVVAGGSTVGSVSMVTVVDITSQMNDLYELGQINKGDLIVEVNERLVIGDDFVTLTKLLQTCQGELLLTIARDKARERQVLLTMTQAEKDDISEVVKNMSVSIHEQHITAILGEQKLTFPKEDDLRKMEARIAHLTKEMRKKDRTLKQLNALLPWKQDGGSGKNIDTNSQEICNLSEDEFIV